MKKLIALLLSLMLLFGTSAALADELNFTTGGTGGVYYAFGTVLAQYISNNTDLAINAVAGNGSMDNIDKLDMNVYQLGFVQNDVAYYADQGIRLFEGDPVNSFTALAALYTEAVQLVTCNPDIKSVAEQKGKNVSIGVHPFQSLRGHCLDPFHLVDHCPVQHTQDNQVPGRKPVQILKHPRAGQSDLPGKSFCVQDTRACQYYMASRFF